MAKRKKPPRGPSGIRRPMLLLSDLEVQEIMGRNLLYPVLLTKNPDSTIVLIAKNVIPDIHRHLEWDTFFEILRTKGLAVFKAQDSDYLKIMYKKKNYRVELIVGPGAKNHGINT